MRCRPIPLLAVLALIAATLPACSGRADRPDDGAAGAAATTAGTAAGEAPASVEPPSPAPTPTADPSSPTPTPAPAPAPAASEAAVPRLSVEEAYALYQSGEAVIVDVRDMASYGASHIVGARPIPLFQVASRADELPRDKRIITYCS